MIKASCVLALSDVGLGMYQASSQTSPGSGCIGFPLCGPLTENVYPAVVDVLVMMFETYPLDVPADAIVGSPADAQTMRMLRNFERQAINLIS
jgi:hypothetical protein